MTTEGLARKPGPPPSGSTAAVMANDRLHIGGKMMNLSTTGAECRVMDSLHNSYLTDGCRVMWDGGLFGRIDCNAVWVDEDKVPQDKPLEDVTVDDLPPGALFVTVTGDDGTPWSFPVQVVNFPLCQCPALMVDTRF